MKDKEILYRINHELYNTDGDGALVGRVKALELTLSLMITNGEGELKSISIKECPKCGHDVWAKGTTSHILTIYQCLTCGSKFTCSKKYVCELIDE